ncbi:MAG: DUF3224 domain-containing protein, partial [Candidatus Acidiferrales bacterium]
MKRRFRNAAGAIAGVCVCLGIGALGNARMQSPAASGTQKETVVTIRAKGTFEVKQTPQPPEPGADASLGRMTMDKQYHGDLEARSIGQGLTAMTEVIGSAGYVA